MNDSLVHYFPESWEALDFCSRVLYGNTVFRFAWLKVRNIELCLEDFQFPDGDFSQSSVERPKWDMWTKGSDDHIGCRRFRTKIELLGTLIADVRCGAKCVLVADLGYTNPLQDEPDFA